MYERRLSGATSDPLPPAVPVGQVGGLSVDLVSFALGGLVVWAILRFAK